MSIFCRAFVGLSAAMTMAALSACMRWDYAEPVEVSTEGRGLFITCEGNFQYGNASLSYYDPALRTVQNDLFVKANGFKLGDVANSMTIASDRGWIVVNNSHVVFAIDPTTCRETGRIDGLTSPRYFKMVSPSKAYVTQIWDNRIAVVDPARYEVTGYIEVPGMSMSAGSTEQMVALGTTVYANCWSYQSSIIAIDTARDRVAASLTVGFQPNSLALDCNGKLWTVTDGGSRGASATAEPPRLWRIDAATLTTERTWDFALTDAPRRVVVNGAGDRVSWINGGVWQMDVDAADLPEAPVIPSRGTIYYGLTIDPETDEIYVADAIDYQQAGAVYRYSPDGVLVDTFYTGVIPGSFAWK